jgi:CheY-like chemotaxis protein
MSTKTILVVDDDADFREVVGLILAREGFAVLSAEGGVRALELLETVDPELLLVDVHMKDMTGPELVREVDRRGRVSPYRIVMVSGEPFKGSSQARWRLTKPLDIELLLRVVDDFCGKGAPNVDPAAGRARGAAFHTAVDYGFGVPGAA